jgi:hypothetical protein
VTRSVSVDVGVGESVGLLVDSVGDGDGFSLGLDEGLGSVVGSSGSGVCVFVLADGLRDGVGSSGR